MFDFHEKRKIRDWLFSRPVIFVLVVLIGLLSVNVYGRFTTLQDISAKREAKEIELEQLDQRAAVLEANVKHLEHKRGVEEELRSRFDVAKEGEQVVIIVDDENREAADLETLAKPPGDQDADEKNTWWGFLKFW